MSDSNTVIRKILLADDSVTIQKVIRITLNQTPHKLFEVKSQEELFKFLQRTPVDLVLLDFTLSTQLDGYSLTTHLKNQFPEVKVMILYGTFDVVHEEKLKAHFVDDFIIKPFESTRFLEKCQQLLNYDPQLYEKKMEQIPQELEEVQNFVVEEEKQDQTQEEEVSSWEMHEFRPSKKEPVLNETLEVMEQAQEQDPESENNAQIIHEIATNPNLNLEIEDWGVAIPPLPSSSQTVPPGVSQAVSQAAPQPITPVHGEIESPENLWDKDPDLAIDPEETKTLEIDIKALSSGDVTQEEVRESLQSYLTQEKMQEMCSKIIEKVVWEVVPELAENIISRELEKIRMATQLEIQNKLFSAHGSSQKG